MQVSVIFLFWMLEEAERDLFVQVFMLFRCLRFFRIFVLVFYMRKVVYEFIRGFKEIILVKKKIFFNIYVDVNIILLCFQKIMILFKNQYCVLFDIDIGRLFVILVYIEFYCLLFQVFVLLVVFMFMFVIYGVYVLGGKLYKCNDFSIIIKVIIFLVFLQLIFNQYLIDLMYYQYRCCYFKDCSEIKFFFFFRRNVEEFFFRKCLLLR